MSSFGDFGACWTADSCTMDPECDLYPDCRRIPVEGDEEPGEQP